MSRWAEAFAVLSRGADTFDTMRHSDASPNKASQSVHSVTVATVPLGPPAAAAEESSATAWGDNEKERAAIVEHDGKIQRAWAEAFARLDPDRPPADVPLRRWQRFIDDIGLFLDSSFCAVAASFGWTACDLFGCNPDCPLAQIDQAGLLWRSDGARIVTLSADAAGIETPIGARQTYRRKPSEPGRLLAWELAS